jgi:S-DNA-T family DNA segregation ATPase FtsK/SpoIIIE
LRSLATSLAIRNSTADVHIYGIDCGNGALTALEPLPHVGAIVTRREPERVDRLIGKLTAETTERQQKLARGGFTTIADQRAMALPEERMPYVVVLLDRWEGFNAEFETADGGRLVTAMMHLMREGHGAGIRVVVTADRSGTSPRFASLADRIIMMRLNDRTVYSIVGLNPRYLPDVIEPGRGFYARGGTEIQVGLLDDDPSGPAQVAVIDRLARAAAELDWAVPDDRRPDPIAALPFHAALAPLLTTIGPGASKSAPVAMVGIGGDRLTPQYLDLCAAGPGFVVTGPPRSGRSNTLMTMAHSILAGGGRVLAVTTRPSPLMGLSGSPGVVGVVDGPTVTAADLAALITSDQGGGLAVMVDDAELIADAPAGEALAAFVRAARDRGSALVIAGTTGELNQFRGFIPETRKSKAGLLLCPSAPSDGEVFGVRLPRTALFSGPPGRGTLVRGAELALLQVPFDDLQ